MESDNLLKFLMIMKIIVDKINGGKVEHRGKTNIKRDSNGTL